MNAFRRLSQNLKTLNLPQLLAETLDDYEPEIVAAIKEQLTYGKRGNSYMPRYNPNTIIAKEKRGITLMTDRVALFEFGDFYASMYAEANGSMITIEAKDFKRDMLVARYTEEIFEISHEQWKVIYSKAENDFKRRVHQWLNQ